MSSRIPSSSEPPTIAGTRSPWKSQRAVQKAKREIELIVKKFLKFMGSIKSRLSFSKKAKQLPLKPEALPVETERGDESSGEPLGEAIETNLEVDSPEVAKDPQQEEFKPRVSAPGVETRDERSPSRKEDETEYLKGFEEELASLETSIVETGLEIQALLARIGQFEPRTPAAVSLDLALSSDPHKLRDHSASLREAPSDPPGWQLQGESAILPRTPHSTAQGKATISHPTQTAPQLPKTRPTPPPSMSGELREGQELGTYSPASVLAMGGAERVVQPIPRSLPGSTHTAPPVPLPGSLRSGQQAGLLPDLPSFASPLSSSTGTDHSGGLRPPPLSEASPPITPITQSLDPIVEAQAPKVMAEADHPLAPSETPRVSEGAIVVASRASGSDCPPSVESPHFHLEMTRQQLESLKKLAALSHLASGASASAQGALEDGGKEGAALMLCRGSRARTPLIQVTVSTEDGAEPQSFMLTQELVRKLAQQFGEGSFGKRAEALADEPLITFVGERATPLAPVDPLELSQWGQQTVTFATLSPPKALLPIEDSHGRPPESLALREFPGRLASSHGDTPTMTSTTTPVPRTLFSPAKPEEAGPVAPKPLLPKEPIAASPVATGAAPAKVKGQQFIENACKDLIARYCGERAGAKFDALARAVAEKMRGKPNPGSDTKKRALVEKILDQMRSTEAPEETLPLPTRGDQGDPEVSSPRASTAGEASEEESKATVAEEAPPAASSTKAKAPRSRTTASQKKQNQKRQQELVRALMLPGLNEEQRQRIQSQMSGVSLMQVESQDTPAQEAPVLEAGESLALSAKRRSQGVEALIKACASMPEFAALGEADQEAIAIKALRGPKRDPGGKAKPRPRSLQGQQALVRALIEKQQQARHESV